MVRNPEPCRINAPPTAEGQLDVWACKDEAGREAVCVAEESAVRLSVLLQGYARWRQEVQGCPRVVITWSELRASLKRSGAAGAMVRVGRALAQPPK